MPVVNEETSFRRLSRICWTQLLVIQGLFLSLPLWAASNIQFGGPELFPLDPRIESLCTADLDGDGLLDVLLNNPRKSKLQILYNQSAEAQKHPADPISGGINELPPDARFRVDSISTEERVTSVRLVDFCGDEQLDIVYCGNLDEVVAIENRPEKAWVKFSSWRLPGIVAGQDSLQVGDFDGDGVSEIVVLTESHFHLIQRQQGAAFGEGHTIQKLSHVQGIRSIKALDLDVDGRDDLLCQLSGDQAYGLIRFGGEFGISNSDTVVELGVNRFQDLVDPASGAFIAVSKRSGRASLGKLEEKPAPLIQESLGDGPLLRIALPKRPLAGHTLAWADLDGDQGSDLIVADPNSGRLLVSIQESNGNFSASREYGTYQDVGQISVSDWDRDGINELFLLSYAESQVGVTRWDSSAVPFPAPFNHEGQPLGMAVGALWPEEPIQLIVVERVKGELELAFTDSAHVTNRYRLDIPIEAARVRMLFHDADQDGLLDLVLLAPYEPLWVLRQTSTKGEFEPVQVASSMRDLDRPWVAQMDVDGDGKEELIIPQGNAVRALVLEARNPGGEEGERAWVGRVKIQLNGEASESLLSGLVPLPKASNGHARVALLDTGLRRLTIQERQGDGPWRFVGSMELPPGEYLGMIRSLVQLGDQEGIALIGDDSVFVKALGGERWSFEVEEIYETDLSGGAITHCVGSDFNQDQSLDLVFLETTKHNVELVTRAPSGRLQLDYRWPVFESRSFRNRRSELPEPREALIDDFTGDGRKDLMLLVHDRVLLYPQQ